MPRMGDDNKDRDDNDDGNKGCQGRPLGESTEDGDLQQCTMCYLSGSIFLHPSRFRTLGMEFSIPVPVPKPSKVIPAHPWILLSKPQQQHFEFYSVL